MSTLLHTTATNRVTKVRKSLLTFFICTTLLVLAASVEAQNHRLAPLEGTPSYHLRLYTEMPTNEPLLFSWLVRGEWTQEPTWIYATDSTHLSLKSIKNMPECTSDTAVHHLPVSKADMDSLLSMIHSAVATVSHFDIGDFCNVPDSSIRYHCMDCGTMVLQYKWRWAVTEDLIHDRSTNAGNLNIIFRHIEKAILDGNVSLFKAELPYIYDLAATFRSYYPKTKLSALHW